MNISFKTSPRTPKGPLAQILTVIIGALLLGAALMFSLVFFAVLAVVGALFWLYFWWKTRAIRAQIRRQMQENREARPGGPEFEPRARPAPADGDVIEGEAVRVAEERDRLRE